jgi:crossover junction endodeoxyribonuclease RusA
VIDHARRQLDIGRTMTTITVPAASQRLSLNDRRHYRAAAKLTAEWRRNAHTAANIARLEPHGPSLVQVVFPVRTNARRDPSNLMPTVKAIVDGLTDAGTWPDDDSRHVAILEPGVIVVGKLWATEPVTVHITPMSTT